MNRLPRLGLALVTAATVAFVLAANVYPDQTFRAYDWLKGWVAAVGPIAIPSAPAPIPVEFPPTEAPTEASTAERYVLLPATEAQWIAHDGEWQPAQSVIESLEKNLSLISQLKPGNWPAAGRVAIDHPERYYRQYVAVRQKGRKVIYVNAFCSESLLSGWRKRLIQVLDGGSCFWQAYYDPELRDFFGLTINGVA